MKLMFFEIELRDCVVRIQLRVLEFFGFDSRFSGHVFYAKSLQENSGKAASHRQQFFPSALQWMNC
jgi:hypothetical protein